MPAQEHLGESAHLERPAGLVHCGQSSNSSPRPSLNDSQTVEASFPRTPGSKPCNGVNYHRRRELTPAQDKIPYRKLIIRQMRRDSLIDSFIPAADQKQFLILAEPPGGALIEHASLGRQQNHLLFRLPLRPNRPSTA